MNFNNHIPIYLQIIDLIKKDLILGKKKPGEKLESVREYSIHLKVNPNTVQKAYQEMERQKLAYSKRGIGRFIIESDTLVDQLMKEMSMQIVDDFLKKMTGLGYNHQQIMEELKDALGGRYGATS